jgi:hypothetical protein
MRCFIRIKNGQPFEHPVVESNFRMAFPEIDVDNLPEDWAPFNRMEQPFDLLKGLFQKPVCTYTLSSDGITWQDTWNAEDISDDEKNKIILHYQNNPPGPNQTFDPATLGWSPTPIKPADEKTYLWKIDIGEWVVVPDKPENGKNLYFDWNAMGWMEMPMISIPP